MNQQNACGVSIRLMKALASGELLPSAGNP